MKTRYFAAAAAAMFSLALLLSSCGGGGSEASASGSLKTQSDIAIEENARVHDPSVFYDEATGTYYAFGSHFAVASSTDLVNWKQVATDGAAGQRLLYGTTEWRSVLAQSDALLGGRENTWAPDVERYNGKYYMYYSLTAGFGSSSSVIGRVESDNVLGPYSNETVIVESATSNAPNKPNCIDPELFYDKAGGLWMVYGSYFGGIYMLELYNEGADWGLPKPDQGFGKLVWATPGDVVVEGPFIFYNKDTDFYYLVTSHGDLFTSYNLRVARSKSPQGPYLDITGADVAVEGGKAYKLAGNYFAGGSEGIAAIGHGSVVEKEGEFFSVSHSRRSDGMGGVASPHSLWTAKLLFNEEGWPVLTPCRYTGEEARVFKAADIAGAYSVLFFDNTTTADFVQPSTYEFSRNGKITRDGRKAGSFKVTGDNYITLKIDGLEFKGAIADCWNTYTNDSGAICISAVSDSAVMLWGIATSR